MATTTPNEVSDKIKELHVTEHRFVENPLSRRLVSDDGKTATYIYGYRAVTLIPHSRRDLSWYAGSGEAYLADSAVSVEEGDGAHDNIMIFAEDIYVYPGSTFSFPGKNVTIFAKRFIAAPLQFHEDNADPILFDLSGNHGIDTSGTPADSTTNGTNGHYEATLGWLIGEDRDDPPTQGGPGTTGSPGGPGRNGGNFYLCADVLSLCKGDIQLRVKTLGGKGGKGQKGGRGGVGGNGALDVYPKSFDHTPDKCLNGGKGGNGGNGGPGGNGGAGGNAFVRFMYSRPQSGDGGGSKSLIWSNWDSAGGPNGDAGDGGDGGNSGAVGSYRKSDSPRVYGYGSSQGNGDTGGHDSNSFGASGGSAWIVPQKSLPALPKLIKADNGDMVYPKGTPNLSCVPMGAWGYLVNPVFVHMIKQRLVFEYEMLFGTVWDKKDVSPERSKFEESLQWIIGINEEMHFLETLDHKEFLNETDASIKNTSSQLIDLYHGAWQDNKNKTSREVTYKALDGFMSLSASGPCIPERDMWQKEFNYIPAVNFTFSELKRVTDSLEKLENFRWQWGQAMEKKELDAKTLRQKINELSSFIENIDTARALAKTDVENAQKEVDAKKSDLTLKSAAAEKALKDVYDKYRSQFDCSTFATILAAVAACFMFTPGATGMVLLGNVLSVGASAMGAFTRTGAASAKVQFVSLSSEIAANSDKSVVQKEIGRLAQPPDKDVLRAILIEKAKFNQLCSTYLSNDDTRAERRAFDVMVTAAQALHVAAVDLQRKLLAQVQLEQDYMAKEISLRALELEGVSDENDISNQFILQAYNQQYVEQKTRVMRYYHNAIRAISALKLANSQTSRILLSLGTWSNVGGADFNNLVLPALQADIEDLRASDGLFAITRTVFQSHAPLTADTHPEVFGKYYDEDAAAWKPKTIKVKDASGKEVDQAVGLKPFGILIDKTNCWDVLGIDLNKMHADVRLVDACVVLHGARLKNAQADTPPIIDITITFGQDFHVTTVDGEDCKFKMDQSEIGSRYRIIKDDPGFKMESNLDNPHAKMVNLGDGNYRAMQSPLTEWNVSWLDEQIDVSSVLTITLHATCTYRPRRQQQTTHLTRIPMFDSRHAMNKYVKHLRLPPDLISFPVIPPSKVYQAISLNLKRNPFTYKRDLPVVKLGAQVMHHMLPTNYEYFQLPDAKTLAGFGTYSPILSERVDSLVKNPDTDTARRAYTMAYQRLKAVHDKVEKGREHQTILADYRCTMNGHEGIVSAKIPFPDAHKAFPAGSEKPIINMFRSFAADALIATGKHNDNLDALKTDSQRLRYMLDNQLTIGPDSEHHFAADGSIKHSWVLLGRSSLIRVMSLYLQDVGGFRYFRGQAVTSSMHALYRGMNDWGGMIDLANPNEIMFANHLLGKNTDQFLESLNSPFAEIAFAATYSSFPKVWDAYSAGPGAGTLVFPDELARTRKWLRTMEAASYPFAQKHAFFEWVFPYGDELTKKIEVGSPEEALILSMTDTSPEAVASKLPGKDSKIAAEGISVAKTVIEAGSAAAPGSGPSKAAAIVGDEAYAKLEARADSYISNFLDDDANRAELAKDINGVIDQRTKAIDMKTQSPKTAWLNLVQDVDFQHDVREVVDTKVISHFKDSFISDAQKVTELSAMDLRTIASLASSVTSARVTEHITGTDKVVQAHGIANLTKKAIGDPPDQAKLAADLNALANEASGKSNERIAAENERKLLDPFKSEDEKKRYEELSEKVAELDADLREIDGKQEELKDIDGIVKDPTGKQDEADKDVDRTEKDARRNGGGGGGD